jgi:hypothetical protein
MGEVVRIGLMGINIQVNLCREKSKDLVRKVGEMDRDMREILSRKDLMGKDFS